jgi:hypothetical protein
MAGTKTHFNSDVAHVAPCGKACDGDDCRDADDEGLLIAHEYFSCGCRIFRHEFHDGSVRTRVIRHDGKVMLDEVSAEHGS